MKTCLYLLLGIFLTTVPLTAQISITAADYFPVLGDTLYVAFDTLPPAELELQAAGGPGCGTSRASRTIFSRTALSNPSTNSGLPPFRPRK